MIKVVHHIALSITWYFQWFKRHWRRTEQSKNLFLFWYKTFEPFTGFLFFWPTLSISSQQIYLNVRGENIWFFSYPNPQQNIWLSAVCSLLKNECLKLLCFCFCTKLEDETVFIRVSVIDHFLLIAAHFCKDFTE